jgi:hypothetical protein
LQRFALGWAVLNHYQHLHKQPSKVDLPKGNYITSLNWRIKFKNQKTPNGKPKVLRVNLFKLGLNPKSQIANSQLPTMRPEHLKDSFFA